MENLIGDVYTIASCDPAFPTYGDTQFVGGGGIYVSTSNNQPNPSFIPFDPTQRTPSVVDMFCNPIPQAYYVSASSSKFLLCSNSANSRSFAACDPSDGTTILVPDNPWQNHEITALAISLISPKSFVLLCAAKSQEHPPVFETIHCFHSPTETWNLVPHQGNIVPNSGVSCGNRAYWLAQNPTSVVEYIGHDIPHGHLNFLPIPDDCSEDGSVLQLGVQGDEILQLVCVTETHTQFYKLRRDTKKWVELNIRNQAGNRFPFPHPAGTLPMPLRMLSHMGFKALFLVGEVLVVFDEISDWESFDDVIEQTCVAVKIFPVEHPVNLDYAVPYVIRDFF